MGCMLLGCFSINGQVADTLCLQGNSQSHLAVAYTDGFKYNWFVEGGVIVSKTDSNDVTVKWGSKSGFQKIEVVAVSNKGCFGDTAKMYIYLKVPTFAKIIGPSIVCFGSEVVLKTTSTNEFIWKGGNKTSEIQFIAKRDTSILLIEDNGPCGYDTIFHNVFIQNPLLLNIDGPNDTIPINSFQDFILQNQNVTDFSWLVDGEPTSTDAFYIHNFTEPGIYSIGVAANFGECSDTLLKNYFVYDNFDMFIPNAFTPNQDGLNEVFFFKGLGIKSYNAMIYTRWGEQLFKWDQNSEVQGWDGNLRNGNPATTGVYLYKIIVMDYNGGERAFQGQLSLLK